MWVSTGNKVTHDDYQMRRVWSLLETIENKTGTMGHEITLDDFNIKLKKYLDGKYKRAYYINYLTKFIDNLEEK